MKTVIFSHGDKGGVGKSVVAAAMVDLIVERYGICAAVDGDNKTPDMRNRFMNSFGVAVTHMQINQAGDASNAVAMLGGLIEKADADFVVINLPSNAGDTLDSMGEMLRDVCDDMDARMVATYSLGEHAEAADGLNASLDGNFLSVFEPQNRMVLLPAFIGEPEKFIWFDSPECQSYVGLWGVFPVLEPKFVFADVIRHAGLFSEMVKNRPADFTAYHKVALKNWRRDVAKLLTPLLFHQGAHTGEEDGVA